MSTLFSLALASHQAGRLGEALTHYDGMLAIRPDLPQIHNNRGLALAELGRLEEAAESYQRAAQIKPDNPETLCNWGVTLAQLERPDAAEAKFRRAVTIDPGFAGAYNNLGLVLKERGRLAEAVRATERAIRLAPRETAYYDNLAAIASFSTGDPYLTALDALAHQAASLSDVKRMHLHFALAKAREQSGHWESAFRHLLAANALKRAQIAYDEAATLGQIDRIRAVFTPQFIKDREGAGAASRVPVFIVGMPRSGTTLIEQILASHPEVFGAGELSLFEQAVGAACGAFAPAPAISALVSELSRGQLRDLAGHYLERLLSRAAGAARITDKMPANFLFAGLIHLAFPNATIIHVIRDPLDTCVSCFSVHFTKGQPHTYDLAELGRYYRHYQSLMEHWRRVLPPGRIVDVHYEDLVADLESVARRVIAHCGLPWNARCLDFHRTDRAVRTASAVQVRKPIYQNSVGRWRRHKNFLGPLLAELAPANGSVVSALRKAS
jgi:tetratricopeptide (TPR) repeat protein